MHKTCKTFFLYWVYLFNAKTFKTIISFLIGAEKTLIKIVYFFVTILTNNVANDF